MFALLIPPHVDKSFMSYIVSILLLIILLYSHWYIFFAFLLGYIEEACIIPCPSDCKLSEWSNWSRCSKSCGSGVKVRSKWLREKPYNGGRPCPKLDHTNQVTDFLIEILLAATWYLSTLCRQTHLLQDCLDPKLDSMLVYYIMWDYFLWLPCCITHNLYEP